MTPSIMDPTSQNFNMFANQMPGYYTPTPGGTNTAYQQTNAGDLHTPGFTMGLDTPHSLPTSAGALNAGHPFAGFQPFAQQMPQHLDQHAFQNPDPFGMHQQQAFPPHHFTHQPTFEHMEGTIGESPIDAMGMAEMPMQEQHQSQQMMFHSQALRQPTMPHPPLRGNEEKYARETSFSRFVRLTNRRFRYYVTLNAPTAMIKHADEIPITYLNKGQAYTLNVHDMHCQQPATPARYRTFVRISFEDDQQRQKPAQCWQLWKEGRGTNEAHQRGGRLQAVEYVESGQMSGAEDPSKPRVQLESASFDGFCVTWSPSPGRADCPISVRFNFLSTDFSHSKGVKGIPVRLCAKTEMLQDIPIPAPVSDPEVCYCKVKLFRDHGAERKLSNDVAHIRKTIEKIDQQIEQMRNGLRDPGNRKKKSGIVRPPPPMEGPGKAAKHSRTWSMNSITSLGGRGSAEDELLTKKATLHDMFNSTHNTSILHLRGTPEDDPDLFPVKLTGEALALPRTDSGESVPWERQSTQDGPLSSVGSPTPSSQDLDLNHRASLANAPGAVRGPARTDSDEWRAYPQTAVDDLKAANVQSLASPPSSRPTTIQRRSDTGDSKSGLIEAVGVDDSYVAPGDRAVKPVACFYVHPKFAGQASQEHFYRAIYLYQRTVKDFERVMATKCGVEPTSILRTVRAVNGRLVLFDDECVVELPEGQDMTANFVPIDLDTPAKSLRDWDSGPSDVQCDGDIPTIQNVNSSGYELRLHY